MKPTPRSIAPASRRLASLASLTALLSFAPTGLLSTASAQTTDTYSAGNSTIDIPLTGISSTSGSANIVIGSGTWAVGDVVYFNGNTTSSNPFGTTGTRYYVVSVSGTTIQVSTTPGGTAINATNTTTATTAIQGADWFTSTTWSNSTIPNSDSTIASFGSGITNSSGAAPVVVNGNATVYGVTFGGIANGDLVLVSGANGTGLYALTFATDDSTTPTLSLTGGSNAIISLGTSGSGSMQLVVAGTQGLIINSSSYSTGTGSGSITSGSGLSAVSATPTKAIRSANVNWSGLSGGIDVERGLFQIQASTGVLTGQDLTVGDSVTTTNNLLSGVFLQTYGSTVGALNGNSLGRIYGNSTITVNGNTSGANYGGVIGQDFTGSTAYVTNLVKTGSGNQTISGNVVGSGAVTVNNGTLTLSGANTYTGITTISGGTLAATSASAFGGGGNVTISGGTLNATAALTGLGNLSLSSGALNLNATTATLASGKNFTMTGGTWSVSLASSSAYDQISGSGTFSITGGTLALSNITNYSLTYQLLSGFGSGSISGLSITGYDTADYTANLSSTGVLSFASAIPEPASYAALVGLGALGVVLLRRRRAV